MPKKKPFNFGKAMTEIEKLLEQLEQAAESDIAKSVDLVEKGLENIQLCKENLKEVENKVQQLHVKFSNKDEPGGKPEVKETLFS